MRIVTTFTSLALLGCSFNQTKNELTRPASTGPISKSSSDSKNGTQPGVNPGGGSNSQSDLTINLNWIEIGKIPLGFPSEIEHFSMLSASEILITEQNGRALILNATESSIQLINSRGTPSTGEKIISLGESSYWKLTAKEILKIDGESDTEELRLSKTDLEAIFERKVIGEVYLRSPRRESIVLENAGTVVQVKLNAGKMEIKRIDGLGNKGAEISADGLPFLTSKETFSILSDANKAQFTIQKMIHKGISSAIGQVHLDISGRNDSPALHGLTLAEGKIWYAGPIQADPQKPLKSPTNNVTMDAKVEQFTLKYCSGCHEGRKPVIIRSADGKKSVISSEIMSNAQAILDRINRSKDDPLVMPQYNAAGGAFPTKEELQPVNDFLRAISKAP